MRDKTNNVPLPPLPFTIRDLWNRAGFSKAVVEQEKEMNDAEKKGPLEKGDATLPE